jgi:hypothetical protein
MAIQQKCRLETYYPTLSTLLKDYTRDVAFLLHFLRFTKKTFRKMET